MALSAVCRQLSAHTPLTSLNASACCRSMLTRVEVALERAIRVGAPTGAVIGAGGGGYDSGFRGAIGGALMGAVVGGWVRLLLPAVPAVSAAALGYRFG